VIPITIHILCFNEQVLLPYTLEFYKARFPAAKFIIIDNMSTDATLHIAQGYGCDIRSFDTEGKLSDLNFQNIKNNQWKYATTDFILMCDCDEWLDINEEQLQIEADRGRTIIRSTAYHMINMKDEIDVPSMTHGFRDEQTGIFYDKCLLFNRAQLSEINYNVGAHSIRPVGNANFTDGTYRMLHYKYLSPQYLIDRYRVYAERMSEENKKNNFGGQFLSTEENIRNEFEHKRAIAQKII
jgi:glycosyltransferase involved in cell wall biosynthesis